MQFFLYNLSITEYLFCFRHNCIFCSRLGFYHLGNNSLCFANCFFSQIFQQTGFSLQNPETFNVVIPWNQVTPSKSDKSGKSHQSSKLLQERVGVICPLMLL